MNPQPEPQLCNGTTVKGKVSKPLFMSRLFTISRCSKVIKVSNFAGSSSHVPLKMD